MNEQQLIKDEGKNKERKDIKCMETRSKQEWY